MSRPHVLPDRRALVLALAFVLLTVSAPQADAARQKQHIALAGPAPTVGVAEDGTGHLAGTVTGKPYDAAYTAQMTSYDGSLPVDHRCEPGWVLVQLVGERRGSMEMSASGSICDRGDGHLRFTGRFEVVHAHRARHVGLEGWLGVNLFPEGGYLEAYETR